MIFLEMKFLKWNFHNASWRAMADWVSRLLISAHYYFAANFQKNGMSFLSDENEESWSTRKMFLYSHLYFESGLTSWFEPIDAKVSARQAGFNDTPYGHQLNTGHFAVQVQLLWNFHRFFPIQNKIFRSICVTLVKFFKGCIEISKFRPCWTAVTDWIWPK